MEHFNLISIDDHSLFRTGIELIVRDAFPAAEFASFPSLGEAMEASGAAPDVVLLDLNLDGIGGLDAIPLIKLRWPGSAIIIVTSEQDEGKIARAREQGGNAVVLKSEPPARFINAIRAFAPAELTEASRGGPAPSAGLSRRQLEVLGYLREGHSNKAIARRLDISEFTVRGHVQHILKLLGASNRAQAVFEAQKAGIL